MFSAPHRFFLAVGTFGLLFAAPAPGNSGHAQLPAAQLPAAQSAAAQPAPKPRPVEQLAARLRPNIKVTYQQLGGQSYQLHIFLPSDWKVADRRPAFVSFHGGGWTGGNAQRMYPFAARSAELGMVGISVEYRLLKKDAKTVFDCVADGCAAIRYLRAHAADLGIDPNKIIVNGASAGGHVAAGAALFPSDDDTNLVSCRPDALVLHYPVIDTSPEGYGNSKIGPRWREISPRHQVRAGLPPTLVFHATGDTVTPFAGAKAFHEAMLAAGNRCELAINDGGPHGYFLYDLKLYQETLDKTETFLTSLKLLPVTSNEKANPQSSDAKKVSGNTYDLLIYEATPGGIAMAVRAAREGLKVVLVNHNRHLGGILSSGLGVWDTLHEGRRSPIYDEVRQAIFDHYRNTYGADSSQYRDALPGKSGHTNGKFEPRVAEHILTRLVAAEPNITVLLGYVPESAEHHGAQLRQVTFTTGGGRCPDQETVKANAFADCSYEGDLLAVVKAPYRVGREARSEFNEPHAGVVYMKPSSTPPTPELAELAQRHNQLNLRKFGGFQQILPQSTGAADGQVQAFNYRTVLTSNPANRIPLEQPPNYDRECVKDLEYGSIVAPLPNQKIGWNRPQLIDVHTAYVEGERGVRGNVMDQHWQATLELLWFLQHDESVPPEKKAYWQRYGLAKDEFADNDHRPYEFYVREARRLTGTYTFTEHDATLAPGKERAPVHHDSIGVTEWYMDAHACTTDRQDGSLHEGKMMLHAETFPGQVPYRTLFCEQFDNLLVPVCLSCTHVAWGSIRLEPTWMNIAESAAYAVAQAKKYQQSPAKIDTRRLLRALAKNHVMISFFNDIDVSRSETYVAAAQYLGTQGFFESYNAELDEPLKASTAQAWAMGLKKLKEGSLNVASQWKAVGEAQRQTSPAITASAFAALIEKTPAANEKLGDQPITRQQALEFLWQSIEDSAK